MFTTVWFRWHVRNVEFLLAKHEISNLLDNISGEHNKNALVPQNTEFFNIKIVYSTIMQQIDEKLQRNCVIFGSKYISGSLNS